jgi:hypothetical protein
MRLALQQRHRQRVERSRLASSTSRVRSYMRSSRSWHLAIHRACAAALSEPALPIVDQQPVS